MSDDPGDQIADLGVPVWEYLDVARAFALGRPA